MNRQKKMAALVGVIVLIIGAAIAYFVIKNKDNKPQNFSWPKFIFEAIAAMFRPKELPLLPSANIRYAIMNNAVLNRVPYWIAFTIAKIESDFNPDAQGNTGDYGLFQITQPVLTDFNLMGLEHSGLVVPLTLHDMLDPNNAAIVACWHIGRLYNYFHKNIEHTVKAYNTGFDMLPADKAAQYWARFQAERGYWESLDYSKL